MISRSTTMDEHCSEPRTDARPVTEMTLVEIARELETITSRIEAERERERQARAVYQAVAAEVEGRIREIRELAQSLVDEQRRRMVSFDGFIGRKANGEQHAPAAAEPASEEQDPRSLGPAILRIWTLEKYRRPLTTDQLVAALKEVGYQSKAAPRSLKSALNQTLAKLCRDGKVRKYRLDGQPIDAGDTGARARRYMAVRNG